MKKLITLLAISTIALTSTFAVIKNTTSFDGTSQNAPEMDVTLYSTLAEKNYNLSLIYGTGTNANDFTDSGEQVIADLDLTKIGWTEEFNVIISEGNLNKSIIFVTEITVKPFIGQVNNTIYTTNNNLQVRNIDNNTQQTTFSTNVNAGPQDKQSVAKFRFHWDADTELPAGDYKSTNTINISVS